MAFDATRTKMRPVQRETRDPIRMFLSFKMRGFTAWVILAGFSMDKVESGPKGSSPEPGAP
jgi:hypothetical protein